MSSALAISGRGFNPFGRAWAAYERSLRKHPVLTQAASSALLWGLGDAMAQRIENRGRGGIDARRVALTAAFGGAVIGPAGHGWYLLLERLVLKLGLACSLKSMLLKVTVDNLLYSPCYVLAFFAYGCMAIDGLSPAVFAEKMREEFVPTMLAEAMLWPPYMAFVFSRVPVKHQLLAVNVATLFDVCFLSWVRTKDEAELAPQQRSQEQQQQLPLLAATHQKREAQAQEQQQQQQGRDMRNVLTKNREHKEAALQEQQLLAADRLYGDAGVARDFAAAAFWPWDAPGDDHLSRMPLLTASATCCAAGGGGFLGLRSAQLNGATTGTAVAAAASVPTR
ncbi:hypothetical protein VOLCADRAFT_121508 [Volvox carteri f. nagariensis]|uniref:Uncharacterized protein n=1 Tax=Volvox carteri f. nagariensis TaxID=3068 RepID=D8UCD9_VOLCA|nr:uncharacterized protein VOLCADRAFT_121508 [Volvox carteri f. nagariensis]EFJ42630.1 hypothetical protein VOLCADRAFT_121508 [Volvox carteri f. nagariensis]|eukprot:XP_002956281.1 hypothetical protein VOLCADRAFT_121508 [Volvox carteri f. nagariensis]